MIEGGGCFIEIWIVKMGRINKKVITLQLIYTTNN